MSDIDLLVLVDGRQMYKWERKVVEKIVVNVAIRSKDVLERMAREHPDTIFALEEAKILYDPQEIPWNLKKEVALTEDLKKELLGDLLDEARSFIGKAERALDEGDLESSLVCLRQGAVKLAELMFCREMGRRISYIHFWLEIQSLSSTEFQELLAEIQGFQLADRDWLAHMVKKLKVSLEKVSSMTMVRE